MTAADEQRFMDDLNDFGAKFFRDDLRGRPNFQGAVDRGDERAVSYWIAQLTSNLEGLDFLTIAATSAYLHDLSVDEQRAGGFDGLLGPDEDVQLLRRALINKLRTLPPPTAEGLVTEECTIPAELYVELFEQLFTRTIGTREIAAFHRTHGSNNGDNISIPNPYLQHPPTERFRWMQEYLQKRFPLSVR